MANFDEIKQKVAETANTVVDKSADFAKNAVEKAKILGRIAKLTAEVAQKAASSELLSYEDLSVDIGSFLLCGDIRVTNEEINILKSLAERQQFDQKKAEPYIGSLNNKLERLKKKTRIRYVMKEGYRLVTDNE